MESPIVTKFDMEYEHPEEIFPKIDLDFLKFKFLEIFFWIIPIIFFLKSCSFSFKYRTFLVLTASKRKENGFLNAICCIIF